MSAPDAIDPGDRLARKLRAGVAAEREGGLHAALRRNKEQLFETLDAPVHTARTSAPYAFGMLVATALAGLLWLEGRPAPTAAANAVTRAIDVAQPAGPAAFVRQPSPAGEHIALNEGTLAFRTRGSGPKLRVVVPDGELEDVGTEFRVTVAGGRTVSIEVSEGLVLFHRHGAEDVRLPAGATWHALPVAVAAGAQAPASQPVASAASQVPKAMPSASRELPSAATDSGEDAAYLRIVALIRESRREEARVASQEYLRRYPNGFRRVEVEQLAR